MINQVVPNSVQNRAFNNFSQPKHGWYLAANHYEEEKEKSRKYGKTVAVGALVAGFGTLALMKGALPKTASKYLEKLKLKLEEKILKGSRLEGFYQYTIEKINSFIEKSQSINNITSLKDVLFKKLMFGKNGQRTFTKKIHENITAFFTKKKQKTVNNSYAGTHNKFSSLNEYMLNLNEAILSKNPDKKDEIEVINQLIKKLNIDFDKGFGINARNKRLQKMNEVSDELYDYFWNSSFADVKNFKSKEMYQSFIADEKIAPYKKEMAEQVDNLKRIVTDDGLDIILSKYEKLLPKKEFIKLKAMMNSAKGSLNRSIHTETVKFFEKSRDLKLGSAPTDVLSILGTVGAVGWFLGKSKDKEERISASLKYGIPAIGAIATSLLCTAKLISGSKAMAFGLVSGWLMNRAGEAVDNIRKNYKLDISLENRRVISEK